MDGDTAPEVPLGVGLVRAQQKLRAINQSSLATRSDEYQEMTSSLVQLLRGCLDQIRRRSLFSANETADDYATSELKLVLAGAYLGEALQKTSGPGTRTAILDEALTHYRQFLSTCQSLGIAKRPTSADQAAAGREAPSGGSARPAAGTAGRNRTQKIERFKRQRAMEEAIAGLEARLAGGAGSDGDDLEDVEREHAVKLIELKIHQVTDDIDLVQSELEMAKQMEAMESSRGSGQGSGGSQDTGSSSRDAGGEWRLDALAHDQIDLRTGRAARPAFNSKGQPMQPFVLTSDRQRIRDGVFRPDWALPTMTIDEYLAQEQARGNIISGGGKEPEPKAEPSDNDHEALDAETEKQREWDDFKDANPRGWGNRGGNRG
ncbi:Type 2A phosphatase-associated protein 42 [Coemansia biformis]|uniref:Type 2A phosphatase-associated protein 42 n=1 Tax=Coemansia biformis TaxID=1286918 RepID=A0A9W7YGY9_9FUNG|nr:Type 2A phosphatase-associated protein 42 [Coemansia biformis]